MNELVSSNKGNIISKQRRSSKKNAKTFKLRFFLWQTKGHVMNNTTKLPYDIKDILEW